MNLLTEAKAGLMDDWVAVCFWYFLDVKTSGGEPSRVAQLNAGGEVSGFFDRLETSYRVCLGLKIFE